MRRALFAAILSCASVATAASDVFSVHLVATPDAPGSRMWRLALPGGGVEEIALESAALLDETAIANADAVRGPGGGGEIRLVLTADGAQRLAELTSRNVGRRFGIVVAGRLRAAPVVTTEITNGQLVVGGLPSAEASTLAKTLGPPSASIQAESESPPGAARDVAALRVIEGNWSGLSATMDGVVIYELVGGTWTFHDGTLTATNGVGDTGRFALTTDVAAPNAFRLDPVAPSRERGGWMIFKREGDRLTLAFFDGFFKRPEDFAPAPKKVVLVLALRARGPS